MSAAASAEITSAVLSVPAAAPAEAAAHYAARLAFEADVFDVHADLESGAPGVVVVDTRSSAAWNQGHIPGALHIPTARIADLAPQLIDRTQAVVTYSSATGAEQRPIDDLTAPRSGISCAC